MSLIKIALISAVIGILVLLFLGEGEPPREREIILVGDVVSSSDIGNIQILEVNQPMKVVLFKSNEYDYHKGQLIRVYGEKKKYNGFEEVVAHRVEVLEPAPALGTE